MRGAWTARKKSSLLPETDLNSARARRNIVFRGVV